MAKKKFDPDAFLLGTDKKGDFDPEAFLREGIESAPQAAEPAPSAPAQPVPPAPKPTTDYKTDIATSPQHAEQLRAEADKQKAADAAALPALAFGAARGATLGGVDRLVGLGTLIGEHTGATDQNPARPGAYQEGRADYLGQEDKARKLAPGMHLLGELAGGAPVAVAAPQSLAGRLAFSGGLGAASGALNTREDDAKKMLTNAGIGGALGVAAEGTVGTVARKLIREAPKREMDAAVRDVMESEAGRATATTGKKLARDMDDVRDVLKSSPDARKAIQGEAKNARPVIQKKVDEASAGQSSRYALVDETLKPLTVTQVLGKLVEAEKGVPEKRLTLVKKGLKALRDALREDFAPKWSGQPSWSGQRLEVPTEKLRSWVSSVQSTAEAAMGGINGTNAAKVPADLAKIANQILEERLDQAAAKGGQHVADAVSQIRESDRQVSAWLAVDRALADREMKELAQNAGLNARLGHAGAANANTAAAALAAEGHPIAAGVVLAKNMASKATHATARAISERILVPLQEAADRGESWASLLRIGAEVGAPQTLVRAVFERAQKRGKIAIPRTVAAPAPASAPPAPPNAPAGPVWPRDYATGTRTQ